MRKRKHRPTKGMTGNYSPLPDVVDSKYIMERDAQIRNRLADLDIIRDGRVLENLLGHPKYKDARLEDERAALADAANISRSRRELCSECGLLIRWATDLVDQDRINRLYALDRVAAELRASAEEHAGGDPDHPDMAAAAFLEQISRSRKESEYCVCADLRARLGPDAV